MARTNSLNNYLTDIATAIKTKKNDETPINASKFDEEIINLPSGGDDIYEYFGGTKSVPGSDYFMNFFILKVPMVDASNETSMNKAFYNYRSLETIPALDTSKVTSMQNMFYGCSKLETIPALNTSEVTDMLSMFWGCKNLIEIPTLNTSNVKSMYQMFYGCSKLETIPQLNASKVSSVQATFSTCSVLTNFGGLKDLGMGYSPSSSANYNSYTLTLSACINLTHESLMNVINNLYDIKSKGCNTQKLVLGSTNLAKLTAEEIAIATNKGWTVA